MVEIRTAQRQKAKIKVGISGPSGAGKTYSSLLLARGMATSWEKVGLIDTENGSGELYSDLGHYNVITLSSKKDDGSPDVNAFNPERYIEAVKAFENAGMEVVIIDSMSHEWDGVGGCLELVERAGGKFQDWAKVTPRHNKFIQTLLQTPMHIVATTRRKQDYEMTKGTDGKVKVEKMGLKEVQRDGLEYEWTVSFSVDTRHFATASKDRTGLFMDKPEFVIGKETGELIADWNNKGIVIDPAIAKEKAQKQKIADLAMKIGWNKENMVANIEERTGLKLEPANFTEIEGRLAVILIDMVKA